MDLGPSPVSWTAVLRFNHETETCKQVESPGVNGNPEDVSKEDARAGSSKLGFGFSSMRREKEERRRAAHELRMQMRDLQFRLRELGTTGGSDSDESISAEPLGVWQRKMKAVYEKSIKPEKFPWERLQQMGVMGEALQIRGKGERLDRPASYRCTTGLFNVLGSGGIRDRSTQVYRKSTRGRRPNF